MEVMNEEMNRYNTIAHKPRSTGELKQLFETTKTPSQKVTKEQQVIRQTHETQTIPEANNNTTSKSKAPNWLKKARCITIEDVGSDHEADGNPNSAKTDSGKKSTIMGDLNPKKSTKSSKQPILADTQAMGSPISSNMSTKTVSDVKNITILRRNEKSIGAKTSEINLIEPIDNARCGKTIDPIIEAQIITEKTEDPTYVSQEFQISCDKKATSQAAKNMADDLREQRRKKREEAKEKENNPSMSGILNKIVKKLKRKNSSEEAVEELDTNLKKALVTKRRHDKVKKLAENELNKIQTRKTQLYLLNKIQTQVRLENRQRRARAPATGRIIQNYLPSR
ncbi:hypothetical protein U1Q18_051721 [Sarracenia purpurea var. burkii]